MASPGQKRGACGHLARLASAGSIANYPLGMVLTYKNLIYLLNLQRNVREFHLHPLSGLKFNHLVLVPVVLGLNLAHDNM